MRSPQLLRHVNPPLHQVLMLILLLLQHHPTPGLAQQNTYGFVSIDCGRAPSESSYTDPATGIVWQPDSPAVLPHTAAGSATVSDESTTSGSGSWSASSGLVQETMKTLRYFPWPSTPTKSCYQLPVAPSNLYLVRAGFFYGNYDAQQSASIRFQVTLQSTVWKNISIDSSSNGVPLVLEAITPSLEASTLSVCLVRSDNNSTPFINTLELRLFDNSTYQTNKPATVPSFDGRDVNFHLVSRANFGAKGNTTLRFPEDAYDRIWPPYSQVYPDLVGSVTHISTTALVTNIPDDVTVQSDEPPSAVMQTAVTAPSFSYSLKTGLTPGNQYSVNLFFAELNATLPPTLSRAIQLSFSFYPPTVYGAFNLTAEVPALSTYQFPGRTNLLLGDTTVSPIVLLQEYTIRFTLSRFLGSTLDPIINADEVYEVHNCDPGSAKADVAALSRLKSGTFSFDEWTGDPCLPVPWDDIQCTNRRVTVLNLSGRNLSGTFALNAIKGLAFLTSLDLSNNVFTGQFPDFSVLKDLRALNLANNDFSGPLPPWVQQSALQTLDISNNQLNGTFPASLLSKLVSGFRYIGNSNLECVPSANATCPLPESGNNVQPSLTQASERDSGLKIVPIIAGTAAVFTVIACGMTALLAWYCCCRKQAGSTAMQHLLRPGSHQHSTEARAQGSPFSRSSGLHCFSLQDIREATNGFSKLIGTGSLGAVHHGVLDGDKQIAVKRMPRNNDQGYAEILKEVDLLSNIHHKNLVALVGYCLDAGTFFLISDYMAGGDLRSRLYDSARGPLLTWQQRLQIAVDAAKGLDHLHQGSMIHGYLTSNKIFLDNKMKAKIAGFGFSHLASAVTGQNISTPGYLDSECGSTGVQTDKSDIYNFGIILLELLSGQPPVKASDKTNQAKEELFIVDRVRMAMNSGNLNKIVDLRLEGEYHVEGCWTLIEIAMSCLERSSARRPPMSKVVSELSLLEIESRVRGSWTNSSNVSGSLVNSTAETPMPSLIFHDLGPRRGM